MRHNFDVIVIGSGFAGSVMAERFAAGSGKRVLVIERKAHSGGHCRDYINNLGIFIHEHGPHIFHTRDRRTWDYLSRFTEWHHYVHEVRASVEGKLIPLPFNLNSLDAVFDTSKANSARRSLLEEYGEGGTVPVLKLKAHPNPVLRDLGEYVYHQVFESFQSHMSVVDLLFNCGPACLKKIKDVNPQA